MSKAYIYPPISAYDDPEIQGSYMKFFISNLSAEFEFLNQKSPSRIGIIDLIKYVFRIDYIFLNWIENISDKRGGHLQALMFIFMVFLMKIRKVKIVWVMHNKISHYKSNLVWKKLLFRFMLKNSSHIITHSEEGLKFLEKYQLKHQNKARYYPHPLEEKFLVKNQSPSIDILIWGSVVPYKGIGNFLSFLYENDLQSKYKIVIAGKVKSVEYHDLIRGFCNKSIILDNRYIPEEDLKDYIKDSKTVLFSYLEDSVLSSGVLMETLSYGTSIVASKVGAFKDTQVEGIIDTYSNYNELIEILDKGVDYSEDRHQEIVSFIKDNNWVQFSQKLSSWLQNSI